MRLHRLIIIACLSAGGLPLIAAPTLPSTSVNGASSNAVFSGGASADGGATFRSGFGTSEVLSVNVDIQVAPGDIGQLGSILVLGTLDGLYYQQRADTVWIPWNGSIGDLQAFDGPRILNESEAVHVIDLATGLFPGKNFQFIVGYSLSGGAIHYTWPPIETSIAGRCAPASGAGSIEITADNAMGIAEIVYRSMAAITDSTSLIDQMARASASGAGHRINCGGGGEVSGVSGGASGSAAQLDAGERIDLTFDNCILGGGHTSNGQTSLTVDTASGSVNNAFDNNWSYQAAGTFANLTQKQGSVPITLDGNHALTSGFFVSTGIQTIDLAAEQIFLDYHGTALQMQQICDETNAFGAGRVHSESSSFRLTAESLGDLLVTTPVPLSGPFGGPANAGQIHVHGANGSRAELDFGQCGDSALALRIGELASAADPCIPVSRFED